MQDAEDGTQHNGSGFNDAGGDSGEGVSAGRRGLLEGVGGPGMKSESLLKAWWPPRQGEQE